MDDTPARRCAACRTPMHGEPAWKTLCAPCYVAAKKAEQAALVAEVLELRSELAELRGERTRTLEPAMLRTLLQLCHPDRHAGSLAATRATQFLLTLKRERAAA